MLSKTRSMFEEMCGCERDIELHGDEDGLYRGQTRYEHWNVSLEVRISPSFEGEPDEKLIRARGCVALSLPAAERGLEDFLLMARAMNLDLEDPRTLTAFTVEEGRPAVEFLAYDAFDGTRKEPRAVADGVREMLELLEEVAPLLCALERGELAPCAVARACRELACAGKSLAVDNVLLVASLSGPQAQYNGGVESEGKSPHEPAKPTELAERAGAEEPA